MDDEILAALSRVRPETDYCGTANFIEDGLLDSFDVVMLVADLDKTFGVSIEGTEILPENFESVSAIKALLKRSGATP